MLFSRCLGGFVAFNRQHEAVSEVLLGSTIGDLESGYWTGKHYRLWSGGTFGGKFSRCINDVAKAATVDRFGAPSLRPPYPINVVAEGPHLDEATLIRVSKQSIDERLDLIAGDRKGHGGISPVGI
jgi:hypothetical protein